MNAQDIAQDVRTIVSHTVHTARHSLHPELKVEHNIAAILTVENDTRYIERTIRAVLEQTHIPATIIVAQCVASSDTPSDAAAAAMSTIRVNADITVQYVQLQSVRSFGEAVNTVLRGFPQLRRMRGLWLLHDDSYPTTAHYLETLLEVWNNAPSTAVIGAKHIDPNTGGLLQVGYYATHHHSVASLVVEGEPDQEQYDNRADVFAVSLAGAIVDTGVWDDLSGASEALSSAAQSADYCRRVSRHGGRVMVVTRVAMAHARARIQGYRALDEQQPISEARRSYRLMRDANIQYYFTDIAMRMWLVAWLRLLLQSIGLTILQLARKNPAYALSEFATPWRTLLWMVRGSGARRTVREQATIPLRSLPMLVASHDQLKQWKDRRRAAQLASQGRMLNQLEREHIIARLRRRAAWAALMTGIVLAITIWRAPDAWHALLTNTGLTTDILPPTGASFTQLVQAATDPIAYGNGLGIAAPPAPFMAILLVVAAITGGHVASAVALIILVAPSAAALSMWALVGSFTRSNAVRISGGLAWAVLGYALGISTFGDLPLLVLMAFLPVSIAFVFRAVGMYRTEVVVSPRSSIQSAAAASLCFAIAVACAPQLVLAMLVLFVIFIALVRSHRIMLIMMPLPSAIVVAPTLFNSIRHSSDGAFRQLFTSVVLSSPIQTDAVAAVSLRSLLARAFGIVMYGGATDSQAASWNNSNPLLRWLIGADTANTLSSTPAQSAVVSGNNIHGTMLQGIGFAAAIVALCAIGVLVILACVTLAVPSLLRSSRLMLSIALAGGALACIASRVNIGDTVNPVSGDTLPGIIMMLMALLCCACMLAGRAAKPFEPLIDRSTGRRALSVARKASARQLMNVGRTLLVLIIIAVMGAWATVGFQRSQQIQPVTAQTALPSVAQDYLAQRSNHRIVAVQADSDAHIQFTMMSTRQGDLIYSNPAVTVAQTAGFSDQRQEQVQQALATLLIRSDDTAIAHLAQLGIGGVYVPHPADGSNATLIAHILASAGTGVVVDNTNGMYARIGQADAPQGVKMEGSSLAVGLWQQIWLWSGIIVNLGYAIVAVPRMRRWDGGVQ